MKKLILTLFIIFIIAGCGNSKKETQDNSLKDSKVNLGIEEGNIVPDIEIYSLKKEKSYIKDFRGKIVMLNFWATWCPPCRSEMPSIQRFYEKNKDVVILAVSVDEESSEFVESFIKENGYSFPVFYDVNQLLSKKFFVRSIPTTYIIDKNGVIFKKITGAFNWEELNLTEIQK